MEAHKVHRKVSVGPVAVGGILPAAVGQLVLEISVQRGFRRNCLPQDIMEGRGFGSGG